VRQLLVTANVVPRSLILVTLMMEALHSFETSVLTRAPEDGILHSHRHENRKSYKSFENVSQFKYLGIMVTKQNLIQVEIKRRLNSDNSSYHSAKNLLSSSMV
jgi:hypothetical protein